MIESRCGGEGCRGPAPRGCRSHQRQKGPLHCPPPLTAGRAERVVLQPKTEPKHSGKLPSHIFPGAENQFECFKCFVILYRLESEKKIPSSQKACIYLITGGDDLVGFGNASSVSDRGLLQRTARGSRQVCARPTAGWGLTGTVMWMLAWAPVKARARVCECACKSDATFWAQTGRGSLKRALLLLQSPHRASSTWDGRLKPRLTPHSCVLRT